MTAARGRDTDEKRPGFTTDSGNEEEVDLCWTPHRTHYQKPNHTSHQIFTGHDPSRSDRDITHEIRLPPRRQNRLLFPTTFINSTFFQLNLFKQNSAFHRDVSFVVLSTRVSHKSSHHWTEDTWVIRVLLGEDDNSDDDSGSNVRRYIYLPEFMHAERAFFVYTCVAINASRTRFVSLGYVHGRSLASLLLTALHYSEWRHRGGSVARLAGQVLWERRVGIGGEQSESTLREAVRLSHSSSASRLLWESGGDNTEVAKWGKRNGMAAWQRSSEKECGRGRWGIEARTSGGLGAGVKVEILGLHIK